MIRDEEDLIKSVRQFVKDNINTYIDIVNNGKSDFNIDSIIYDDSFFVMAAAMTDLPNHNFINFAFNGEIQTLNNYDDSMLTVPIIVEHVFSEGINSQTFFKSLRYMIAIRRTLLKFVSSTIEVGESSITSSRPVINVIDSRKYIISGVGMTVTLS